MATLIAGSLFAGRHLPSRKLGRGPKAATLNVDAGVADLGLRETMRVALLSLLWLVDGAQVQVNRWSGEGSWWSFGTSGSSLPEDVQALVAGEEEARPPTLATLQPESPVRRPAMIQKAQVQMPAQAAAPSRPRAEPATLPSKFVESPSGAPPAAAMGALAALFSEPKAAAEAATSEEERGGGELRSRKRRAEKASFEKRFAAAEAAAPTVLAALFGEPRNAVEAVTAEEVHDSGELHSSDVRKPAKAEDDRTYLKDQGRRAELAEKCLELASWAQRAAPKGEATALFLSGCAPLAAQSHQGEELCGSLEPQLVGLESQEEWASEACNILMARLDQQHPMDGMFADLGMAKKSKPNSPAPTFAAKKVQKALNLYLNMLPPTRGAPGGWRGAGPLIARLQEDVGPRTSANVSLQTVRRRVAAAGVVLAGVAAAARPRTATRRQARKRPRSSAVSISKKIKPEITDIDDPVRAFFYSQCPPEDERKPEIAFFGQSNVGKSSLLNFLCQRKKLTTISKRPGHTKLIHHFLCERSFYLVDMPGIGYAEGKGSELKQMDKIVTAYVRHRQTLVELFYLVDGSHQLQLFDLQGIKWLADAGVNLSVILTKMDEPRRPLPGKPEDPAEELLDGLYDMPESPWKLGHIKQMPLVFKASTKSRTGREAILEHIADIRKRIFLGAKKKQKAQEDLEKKLVPPAIRFRDVFDGLTAVDVSPREITMDSLDEALFKYNRKNFMFDKKLKQEREFQEQDMRVAQFRLYREDVRDLVELTVGKMDLYLVSSALLIDRTTVMITKANEVPALRCIGDIFRGGKRRKSEVAAFFLLTPLSGPISRASTD
ncbi:putative GTP-binding protein EngB [Symbiodinium microadriaticum]|uniref:Putative GTP-binding protein EngB n=2 Tax=Symbiodinium TaxID=2949 RepID=A0A1Q9DYS3_SYMMI|nr:putative GTP-binding protein EngB [Symbiodinium microadriaticum]